MNSMIEELRKISLENELWLKYKICGKIFYFISNKGRFASIIGINPNRSKGRCWKVKLITPYSNSKGYMIVRTRENNKTNYHQVHRMVMSTFCPLLDDSNYQVNHIDGDKSNNNLSNLEWCTCKENIQHAIQHKLIDNTKQVSMYSLEGEFIKEFGSITNAEKETGVLGVNISFCCSNKIRQAGGYQWRYEKFSNIDKVRPKKIAEDLHTRGCKQIDMYNGTVKVQRFASVLEAAKFIGKPNAQVNISACALGKRKTAYGYSWAYVN